METPYGEIPEKFIKDMSVQEMHDYLKRRYSRRSILKGAGALGLAAVAGPIFWKQSSAFASTPTAPQWIAFGADPTTQMYISWSTGTFNGSNQAPSRPQVRWGLDAGYGSTASATNSGTVPVPAVSGEPTENTIYNSVLLSGLTPGTTYHYAVTNDGVNWSPDTSFATARADLRNFRFAVVGDEAISAVSSLPVAQAIANFHPAFTVVAGDLSYASSGELLPDVSGFMPGAWDTYLGLVGPAAAQSIPWMVGVGNHEMEPLDHNGYDGFLTRFPQAYDPTSGSQVVKAFTYGNVAILQLDGNDLSAEISNNNGYTGGVQTTWLINKLAGYRTPGSGIDFIIVTFHNCMFCSNQTHGSDGGIRTVWEPIFDQFAVDLVINGHVHAYERTNPLRAGVSTRTVPSGGTVSPVTDGTTYICAGGGGQTLYPTWYGPTGGGDPGSSTGPKINVWSGTATAEGGTGTAEDVADTSAGYSAFRHAIWSFVIIDVLAPTAIGGQTSLLVQAIDPSQNADRVWSICNRPVMDSVTIGRTSTATPPVETPEIATPALLVAGAGVIAGGAYLAARRNGQPGA
jgi:hypothetical protein